jgi:tRNA A37 threonylcarbamoyltransferase TsaD
MKLLICAQDIASISFGQVENGRVVQERKVVANPEGYLAALHGTLDQWNSSPHQIQGIYVVTGPGSFTASRVSTTIANTLAFSQGVHVIAVQNPDHLPVHELELPFDGGASYASPTYDRPPEITMSKKDRGDNTNG